METLCLLGGQQARLLQGPGETGISGRNWRKHMPSHTKMGAESINLIASARGKLIGLSGVSASTSATGSEGWRVFTTPELRHLNNSALHQARKIRRRRPGSGTHKLPRP